MSIPRAQDRPSRWRRPERVRRDLGGAGLLVALAVASALLLLPRGDDGLIGLPPLEAGDVAPRTVRSSRAFSVVDPALTSQSRERARAAVRPVFDHLLGLAEGPKARLEAGFIAASTFEEPARRAEVFIDAVGARASPAAVLPLVVEGEETGAALDAASMLLDELFALKMVSEPELLAPHEAVTVRSIDPDGRTTRQGESTVDALEALGPNQARARVDALASERLEHLAPPVRRAVAKLVKDLLTPNLVENAQETLRRRRIAWLSVKPSVILVARSDRVIQAGEPVTKRDLLLLGELARLESPQARLQSFVGSALLGLLLAWLAYRAVRYAYRHRRPKQRDLVFLSGAFVAFLLLIWLGYKVVDWLAAIKPVVGLDVEAYRLMLPVAAVAILIRLAAGPIAAAVAAPACGLLAGWMMDGNLDFAAYTVVGALAGATTEPGVKRVALSAGLRAGFAQAVLIVGAALLATGLDPWTIGMRAAIALGSGFAAAGLARVAIPAVEALFGYTTPSGLAVFADAEHPLLRDLLVEVPGTYHHSLQVGALAEAGADAIGSDRLLARVGGYFHDVGRLSRTETEPPQAGLPVRRRGRNRSKPRERTGSGVGLRGEPGELRGRIAGPAERRSAAATLAAEHRFPAELTQILAEQPHEAARSVDPAERRPKPRSKASALVFLADWVEDALRGREGELEHREALEATVRSEVRAAVAARLLDEADLELRELAAVSAAFAGALEGRFVDRGTPEPDDFRFARPPHGAPS